MAEIKNKFLIFNPNKDSVALLSEQFKSETEVTNNNKKTLGFNDKLQKELGDPHPFDFKFVEDLSKKFGLINANLDKYSDFILGRGISVDSPDERGMEVLNDWIRNSQLVNTLRPWLREALSKGNGFMEVAVTDRRNEVSRNRGRKPDPTIQGVQLKNIDANNMFVKRDKKGKIGEYNQFIGKSMTRIDPKDKIKFAPEEIAHLLINKIGDNAYGFGIVWPSINIINNFLSSQRSLHTLISRKAGSPLHVKIGSMEHDDIPTQTEIDAFGNDLNFMDERTEYVTGPNIDMSVIDFGNINAKYDAVLENDYLLLSHTFEIPEVLSGKGNIPEGLAEVQLDAFERRINSIQQEVEEVLREKILGRVLQFNGIDIEYKVIWGLPSDKEIFTKITKLSTLLGSNMLTSPGLRKQLEIDIAQTLKYNLEEIQADNEEAERKAEEKEKQMMDQARQQPNGNPNPEREREENNPLPEVPGQKNLEPKRVEALSTKRTSKEENHQHTFDIDDDGNGKTIATIPSTHPQHTHVIRRFKVAVADQHVHTVTRSEMIKKMCADVCPHCIKESSQNMKISEWIGMNLEDMRESILNAVRIDNFDNLLALNRIELEAGFLSSREVEKFREILINAFKNDMSVKDIEALIRKEGLAKPLFDFNKEGAMKDKLIINEARRANMLARTETVRLSHLGALADYKNRGVEKVRFVASLSRRTCDRCESLNGMIFTLGESISMIPVHTNCRCAMLPVIEA